ncbi:MAG: Ig-like domain-containing protein, partial [Gemmatimonadaceae bacterium]
MLSPRFVLALVAGILPFAASSAPPLRVLRVSPSGAAGPTTAISITFDRPVAGSLDYTVNPAGLVRVEPAVAGKVEWRDPVSIVFTPATRLQSATRYTVTVANSFRAMDGSRLAEPYRFSFRVHGPRLLGGSPVSEGDHPRYLTARPRLELLWSAPVELPAVSAATYLELAPTCPGA